MTMINLSKTFTGIAAAAITTATLTASGSAFAHGMGHMSSGMGTHTTNFVQTNGVTKTSDHGRDHDRRDRRHRRFIAFGYVAPDYACIYKRTIDGLVKICPDDWY
jgi:hypothetical protein